MQSLRVIQTKETLLLVAKISKLVNVSEDENGGKKERALGEGGTV